MFGREIRVVNFLLAYLAPGETEPRKENAAVRSGHGDRY